MYELKVVSRFAAAHQLQMVTKKCENLHGHNWRVEAYLSGQELNAAGVLMDFTEIKQHLSSIIDTLDHKFLNDLEWFHDKNPSSENIARYIAMELAARIPDSKAKVCRVSVWESDDACASYFMPS